MKGLTVAPVASVEEAVDQQINLGLGDPLEIADAVIRLYGGEEILGWFDARLLLMDVARGRIGLRARSQEAKAMRSAGSERATHLSLHGVSRWVPGSGWVPLRKYTAEDATARGEYLVELGEADIRKGTLYLDVAAEMRAAGAAALGELPALLERLVVADSRAA